VKKKEERERKVLPSESNRRRIASPHVGLRENAKPPNLLVSYGLHSVPDQLVALRGQYFQRHPQRWSQSPGSNPGETFFQCARSVKRSFALRLDSKCRTFLSLFSQGTNSAEHYLCLPVTSVDASNCRVSVGRLRCRAFVAHKARSPQVGQAHCGLQSWVSPVDGLARTCPTNKRI
jgi:hypothetical protein